MLEGLVNGQNQLTEKEAAREAYAPAFDAYKSHAQRFVVKQTRSQPRAKVHWLLNTLE
jgi:hypothetical protein